MPLSFNEIPDWFSWENQGAGIAVVDVDNDGQQDLFVLNVDSPPGQNQALYKVGKKLDASGKVTGGWGNWIAVPDWFSWNNQGAGLSVFDLDNDGRPELIVFMIDNPQGQNQAYYRVGKKLDLDGQVSAGWGPWIAIPDWFPFENQHGSIAVADLDHDGQPELVVFMIDNPEQQNQGYIRVGRKLDADGNVTGGWSPWLPVPEWFSWENQGAGVTLVAGQVAGQLDLIVFQIDNAVGQNQAFYKIARNLKADGSVAGGWSTWLGVPDWFSWENQGGAVASVQLGGKKRMVALQVDNPPEKNSASYEVLDLEEDPTVHGKWELLSFHSGILAVHTAVLPGGKVLFFAGSGSSYTRFTSPDFGDVSQEVYMSVVWDPQAAAGPGNPNFAHPATLRFANGKPFDFFCCGHAFLPDGRLVAGGGTLDYNPFRGRAEVAVFDPATTTWSFINKMAHGRWYPTLITLGDGRLLATTGLDEGPNNDHNQQLELYSAQTNTWQQKHFAPGFLGLPLYAHLFLLRDGRIFFSGGRMDDDLPVQPCVFNVAHDPVDTQTVPDLLDPILRNQSASVLLPPAQDQKVMIMGGGPAGKPNKADATGMVSIVDLKAAQPTYVAASPMKLPRMHLNAVLLPDHTVFVCGGSLKQEDEPLSRLQAELYDPASDSWSLMATAQVPRLYHSTAVLLPDGRVLAAGGNPEGGHAVKWEPPDPEEEMRLEVFSPPYLFKGPRPVIGALANTEWHYGDSISIPTTQAGTIRWASLISAGVTTHSFNCSQRLVDLDLVSQAGGAVKVKVTNEPNLAPPGWYMLFLTDSNGVPSVAKWVHLT